MNTYNFYTDGACAINKTGGWAFYCPELSLRVCNKKLNTTNNYMELLAVYKVLNFLNYSSLPKSNIVIYTDSMYVLGGYNLNWHITTNMSLWNDFKSLLKFVSDRFTIDIKYVKGHANILENEIVDQMAFKIARS